MRIAIDVSQMCYAGTGVARYLLGLTEALLNQEGDHTYLLFAGTLRQRAFFEHQKTLSPWNKAEWKIVPLPPKVAGIAFNTLPIPIETIIGPFDIFHSSDWAEPSTRGPSVTTIHDLVFVKYPETVDRLILNTESRRLKKIISGKVPIIADSKSTKNDLVGIYNLKPDLVDVVYPGIDSSYKPQSSKEVERVKTKYKLPVKYILSLGTQEPRKNISRLVDAVKPLNIPLVIVGRHGWGNKTQSLGYVDDSDIRALYTGATVFAYPSLYEGFGFPVLEAMACGTPVVTSNISSLPEIAGDACVLVDPKSVETITMGISTAIQNRATYIERGLIQSQKFGWDATAKQTLEVYDKVIKQSQA